MALPPQRRVLTDIIDSLSQTRPSDQAISSIQGLGPHLDSSDASDQLNSRRRLLLTLHVLFPNHLLSALDLLDRGFVTRVFYDSPHHQNQGPRGTVKPHLHLVRSLATRTSQRHRGSTSSTSSTTPTQYVVRLEAWSCTCVNFVFDTFASPAFNVPDTNEAMLTHSYDTTSSYGGSGVGGLPTTTPTSNDMTSCCKHLLACLLAERCQQVIQGAQIGERKVRKEELVGLLESI